jgi:hypothetical protein
MQAPAHRTAPHHHHAPAVGGVTHNEDLMVDLGKLKAKMERVLAALQREFAGVRGGKPDAGGCVCEVCLASVLHPSSSLVITTRWSYF